MSRLAQAVFVVLAGVCLILANLGLVGPAAADTRVALVIGNSSYLAPNALANPAKDARAVAAALKQARFTDVTLAVNLNNSEFQNTLKTFARKAATADVALVYYAGHGLELNGTNYLVPVDASLTSASDLSFETVTLDQVMTAVNGASRLKVVILDACRSNPFVAQMTHGTRGMRGGGLARVQPEPDMLVAYAAREGTTAADGDGDHSPYSTAFINRLTTSHTEIRIMFGQVSDDVRAATHGMQEPAVYTSLGGTEFYLNTALTGPGGPTHVAASPAFDPRAVEIAYWDSIKSSADPADFQAYLGKYPDGAFVGLARNRLALNRTGPAPTAPVADVLAKARAAFTAHDYRKSLGLFRQAADAGNAEAQIQLGYQYENALGVGQDYAEAANLYRTAADRGNAIAQSNLGTLYVNGHGVPQDYGQAFFWVRKAAEQGYATAEANLGVLYGNGRGTAQNYPTAILWLRKAAAQGEPYAEGNLAYFYASGLGTPRSLTEARKWYVKSAAAGNATAKQWLTAHPG